MDAYEIHDARNVQTLTNWSGADGLVVSIGPVPAGKVWTILAAYLSGSITETRTFWFAIVSRSGLNMPVTVPVSFLIAPLVALYLPLVTEGMELRLLPGESLSAFRSVATAGSTIGIAAKFIETDLPYYSYVEPLKKIVNPIRKHGSFNRAGGIVVGGTSDGGGGTIGRPGGERGGGTGEPI